jgi:chemotaxis receptor (MCP) glutamine deamidase CheD
LPVFKVPARPAPAALPPGATPAQVAARIRRIIVGETFATATPTWISTVLGSCVAACIYDPEQHVGGMNHFLLPEAGSDGDSARYGAYAMDQLIEQIVALGADRRRLAAKVFGAAHAMGSTEVARRNEIFIRGYLERASIPIRGTRLGGAHPIEVRFETGSGRALCRYLSRPAPRLTERERERLRQAARALATSEAEPDADRDDD